MYLQTSIFFPLDMISFVLKDYMPFYSHSHYLGSLFTTKLYVVNSGTPEPYKSLYTVGYSFRGEFQRNYRNVIMYLQANNKALMLFFE